MARKVKQFQSFQAKILRQKTTNFPTLFKSNWMEVRALDLLETMADPSTSHEDASASMSTRDKREMVVGVDKTF